MRSPLFAVLPLSCDFDPVLLTAERAFTLLMKIGLHTFLLKLMQLLAILVAQIEL